jgi:hypothetical protein
MLNGIFHGGEQRIYLLDGIRESQGKTDTGARPLGWKPNGGKDM